jgi:hypothetical protein
MTREGFELMAPVFERAKTVHASDHAATVIDRNIQLNTHINNYYYVDGTPHNGIDVCFSILHEQKLLKWFEMA